MRAAVSFGNGRFFAVFLYGEGKENERTDQNGKHLLPAAALFG